MGIKEINAVALNTVWSQTVDLATTRCAYQYDLKMEWDESNQCYDDCHLAIMVASFVTYLERPCFHTLALEGKTLVLLNLTEIKIM